MHADCNIFLFSLPLSFCHKNFAKVKLRLGVRFDLSKRSPQTGSQRFYAVFWKEMSSKLPVSL